MQKKVIISCLVALTGMASTTFDQGLAQDIFSLILTPAQQCQCGLHKLTASERTSLARAFSDVMRPNSLGDSALEYLKHEGWEEVEVLGTRKLKTNRPFTSKEYVMVEKGTRSYILDPKTFCSLSPGTHLGKMGFTSCEIINCDGQVARFWTEDTK